MNARASRNWRTAKPAWSRPRNAINWRTRCARALRRAGRWALYQLHPDAVERRKIYTYWIIASWLVMVTIGVLAAHGIHP